MDMQEIKLKLKASKSSSFPLTSKCSYSAMKASGESPWQLSWIDYPDLILFELAFPLDFNIPLDSPSDEGSIDLVKLLERSA